MITNTSSHNYCEVGTARLQWVRKIRVESVNSNWWVALFEPNFPPCATGASDHDETWVAKIASGALNPDSYKCSFFFVAENRFERNIRTAYAISCQVEAGKTPMFEKFHPSSVHPNISLRYISNVWAHNSEWFTPTEECSRWKLYRGYTRSVKKR